MRVGVDFRILAVGSQLIRRGLGRYTQQQLRAVLDLDHDNEYLLLCPRGADTGLIDPDIRRASNVALRRIPTTTMPDPEADGDDPWPSRLRRAEAFQDWVAGQDIDLFHATTPFFPTEPMLATFDACPYVATFYDVIPLLFPQHYFVGAPDRGDYLCAVSLVRGANRMISISGASRDDAVALLGVPADRIDVAYPTVESCFRPMARPEVEAALARLATRFRIPERFVLTVSYPHHAKNLETLLLAYSRLSAEERRGLPLVACCTVDPASGVVWPMARQLGIADDLILTGPISDHELAALYAGATFVVHPSRYEGFGLPVAEAMGCGTPVITTTMSSLPEVGGDAVVLVDPDDVDGMTAAMRRLLRDPDERRAMAERGLVASARFNPADLGAATLDSYRRALAPEAVDEAPTRRPRIAVWSPLPPEAGGVADSTDELLRELVTICDVEVFVDEGVAPSSGLLGRQPIHHFGAFDRRRVQAGFDAVVYELGASAAHAYMYRPLLENPGIVVLRALDWGRVLHEAMASDGRLDEFEAELAALEGEQALAELRGMVDDLGFWERHPMLGRVIDASVVQLVSDPDLARAITWRYPDALLRQAPVGVVDPFLRWPAMDIKSARAALGIDSTAFVVGVFGTGIDACLRAVDTLAREDAGGVLLLVGGRPSDPAYRTRVEALARGAVVDVRFADTSSLSDRQAHLMACDVVVDLDVPSGAESTDTWRALAAGKPVIVADRAGGTLFPVQACALVPTDGRQVAALAEQLRALRDDEEVRARQAAAARRGYEEHGTLGGLLDAYLDIVQELTGTTVPRTADRDRVRQRDVWEDVVGVVAG